MKKPANKHEQEKAFAEIKKQVKAELSTFPTVHTFEIGECTDKDGEKTRVLEIDLDKVGVLGLFMEYGQPMSFDHEGQVNEDRHLIKMYFSFMSNVEITEENLQAIGWESLQKAREAVRNFFMLRLVSALSDEKATEKRPSTTTTARKTHKKS